jgi:predicted SAM-dependent methyltransferase
VYANALLLIAQIITKISRFIRHVALLPWQLIGSLKFRRAYRNACKQGFVCLHVGANNVRLDGCLNTDIMPVAPLYLDASKHLPIKDNTVDYVYGEHFIEYLPRQAAIGFFQESFRILKPDGMLRVSTPDIEAHAKAYLHEPELARLLNERNRERGYQHTNYPVDILNKTYFEDDNVSEYDAESLRQMLESVGFRNLTRCKIGESTHAALCGIERHDLGSVADQFTYVVEAAKPVQSQG